MSTPILVLCTAQVWEDLRLLKHQQASLALSGLGSSDTHDLRNSIRLKCGSYLTAVKQEDTVLPQM